MPCRVNGRKKVLHMSEGSKPNVTANKGPSRRNLVRFATVNDPFESRVRFHRMGSVSSVARKGDLSCVSCGEGSLRLDC